MKWDYSCFIGHLAHNTHSINVISTFGSFPPYVFHMIAIATYVQLLPSFFSHLTLYLRYFPRSDLTSLSLITNVYVLLTKITVICQLVPLFKHLFINNAAPHIFTQVALCKGLSLNPLFLWAQTMSLSIPFQKVVSKCHTHVSNDLWQIMDYAGLMDCHQKTGLSLFFHQWIPCSVIFCASSLRRFYYGSECQLSLCLSCWQSKRNPSIF